MNISKETKARLVEILQADIVKHQEAINRINKDIASLQNGEQLISPDGEGKQTFKSIVLGILKDGKPRPSRELLNEFIRITKKNMTMPTFSSQLSPMVSKYKILKIHNEPDNPFVSRNFYGKPEWFNGDKLKGEYSSKIILHKN